MPANEGTLAPRLVLDTNVVVAGLLWSGPPRRLLELATGAAVELFSSPVLLDELTHTLQYPKLSARIERFGESVQTIAARYAALVSLVIPATIPRIVVDDADDDHVIAAAIASGAQFIVTGDRKHLLPIGSHQGVAIVTARDALSFVAQRR